MGKAVKVMVILYFLLSVVVLWQGAVLLGQRQELKGRLQNLENTFVRLGGTLELDEPLVEQPPQYVSRDISPTVAEELADPDRSNFWDEYRHELEVTDREKMNLKPKREQLKKYYQIDPMTGKPRTDSFGLPIASGPDTMHEVLDIVVKQSGNQLNRLNATRQELIKLREELVATIEDLNRKKKELRLARQEIVQRDTDIVQLEGSVSDLRSQVAGRDSQITTLQDEVASLDDTIAKNNDAIAENEADINQLEDLIKAIGPNGLTDAYGLPRGTKGTVISAPPDWSFALVRLTPDFLDQLLSLEGDGPVGDRLKNLEMFVRRAASEGGGYVAKVKLRELRLDESVAVVDVLGEWQSGVLRKGDEVYY